MTFEPTVGLAQPSWTPNSQLQREAEHEDRDGDDDSESTRTVLSKKPPLRRPAIRPKAMPKTAWMMSAIKGEHGRDREDPGQSVGNRLAGEVVAEVEGEEALEEKPVLDPERLVQVVLAAQLRDDRLARRAVPEEGRDGVAREGRRP